MKVNISKLHKIIDYVPVVSNFKNVLDFIVKKTSKAGQRGLKAQNSEPTEKSAKKVWVDFAQNKSDKKIALLIFVPVISNIALLILSKTKKPKIIIEQPKAEPVKHVHFAEGSKLKAVEESEHAYVSQSTPLVLFLRKAMKLNGVQSDVLDDCYWKVVDELKNTPKEAFNNSLIYSKILNFLELRNTLEEEYDEKTFLANMTQIADRLTMFKSEDRVRLLEEWKPGEIREFTFEVFSKTPQKSNSKSKWDQLIVRLESLSRHQPFLDQLQADISEYH